KAYSARYSDLSEFCFLFPNKRSGTFFLKYLKEESEKHVMLSPHITTITDFVGKLSGRVVAGRLDLLFMLYGAYNELSGGGAGELDESDSVEFDSFRGWGETVLSDFSEADQYMVNTAELFKNVKDYREISSNFLTKDQKRVLEEYFGRTEVGDSSKFWKNFDKEDEELSNAKRRFLHLWRIMAPLYDKLNEKLAAKGLTTTGGAYRLAVETLRENGRDILPYKKVVAIGFNALSTTENFIFNELKNFEGYEGFDSFADFFWDMTGPILTGGVNSASKFVKANINMFPCPDWALSGLRLSETSDMPKINVVASPSNSAQVKITGNLLSELRRRITAEEITNAKVAVVLPDENLLLPMLYSLPDGMGKVNLTMGYSLRLTSVVPFVTLLRKLQLDRRRVGGEECFYHNDLRLFLAHPFSHAVFGSETVREVVKLMDKEHRTIVKLSELHDFSEDLSKILDPAQLGETPLEVVRYIEKVLNIVKDKLEKNGEKKESKKLETSHINIYLDGLRRLTDILEEYRVNMKPPTVFYLADRMIAGETVRFEGEPLTGLQVMGTLETRSLDFDHLFILSMNERIMPLRARMRTFIANSLRNAFGMPPANYAESIFAYYFYRMICRAKEVTLLYDARTGGGQGAGDVSRYIVQLRHLFAKDKINDQEWKFILTAKEGKNASVEKNDEITSLLSSYLEEGGKKRFSASSLNDYRECQVKFFYRDVMGINTDPEPSEFIDAIGAGNILHTLMEELYVPENMRGQYLKTPLMVTGESLDKLIADEEGLRRLTTRIVNRLHYKKWGEDLDTPLFGASEIVAERIMEQAVRVMKHDRALTPFKIYGTEIKDLLRINLPSGKTVNFKFAIDRLDEIMIDGTPHLRIVDYKTGSIKLKAADMEEVMTGDYKSEQIFQLFTYAWLLNKQGIRGARNVMMEIYNVPKIFLPEVNYPEIDKQPVADYSQYSAEFSERIEQMLESVFDSPAFKATEDARRCEMCGLREICRR
ncbi:MAG: PD-(D/E)XK nuclease family protein, partial [Muribaculaceae bacterium]|nr:PD-(D/E)XK nuclease family protein [Muribaculaceae bacterium]